MNKPFIRIVALSALLLPVAACQDLFGTGGSRGRPRR